MTSRSGSCPFPSNQNRSPNVPLPHNCHIVTRATSFTCCTQPPLCISLHPCNYPIDHSMPLPPTHQKKSSETASKIPFKSSSRTRVGLLESLNRSSPAAGRLGREASYVMITCVFSCAPGMEGRCGVEGPRSSTLNRQRK